VSAGVASPRVIGGRYALRKLLGEGGQGEVWEADDPLAGTVVAVKLLEPGPDTEPARVRREVSALRLLRLPGVVRLLDEGTDEGQPFLVMDRLVGAPFPGSGNAGAWPAMARVTLALVEILARIHAAGVVHRDLKPANVLVDAAGVPTILDFGMSAGRPLGAGLTRKGEMLGTPAYLAPEQIFGEPTTSRTDLYALGVMLYEALSGHLPHEADNLRALLLGRLAHRPRPLREMAPGVPPSIAGLVDLLLARAPEDRPRSAAEVLAVLRGQPVDAFADPPLPRLGGDAAVNALVAAARLGRSLDLVGPSGSGRTRALRDAAAALERAGARTAWLGPDRRPFGSVVTVVGELDRHDEARLSDVMALVEARLGAALRGGAVLIADDAENLDPWSAAALARQRAEGCVLRALRADEGGDRADPVACLSPLTPADLLPLFGGRDRLFHLRTDAAGILWDRTLGLAARVAEEVTAWVRAGLARRDEGRLLVDRDAIDRLASGLHVVSAGLLSTATPALPAHLEELCAWIELAWPSSDPALLARAMELPVWRVEAEFEELCRRGAARARAGGGAELLRPVLDAWPADRRRAAHQALARALPEGTEGRLLHMLAGGDDSLDAEAVAREASALALNLARAGHLGRAMATLSEGLLATRGARAEAGAQAAAEERLFAVWVEIALSDGTPPAQDRVLYELCRAPRTPALEQLEALLRAYLAFGAGGERASDLITAVPPFRDPDLERRRQSVRVLAARRCSRALEETVLADVVQWAKGTGDPLTEARCAGWLGRLRYRQGRFEEAARLHAGAADGETWMAARVAARINAASALMEAFAHEQAAAWAEEALLQARACRHAFYEGRATWIVRSTAYRQGAWLAPDLELVEAVAQLGVADLEGAVGMTEAAFAYRAGDRDTAARLGDQAAKAWLAIGMEGPGVMVRALAIACGAAAGTVEIEALAARAMRCPIAGIGLQALALLAEGAGGARPAWRETAPGLAEGVGRAFWGVRMDVLSVSEALGSLGGEVRD
jgi:hypothetical protein